MVKFIHDDMCEEILLRLDVKDLVRCRSVCKSWKSLILHPRFVKAHHTRQVNINSYRTAVIPNYLFKYGPQYYMVGSSNGLACISSFHGDEIIVANPWTREERMLQKLLVATRRSCWGFGYDALTDDYKVVCGVWEGGKTAFHVFSLKSNVWRHVGHVNYTCFGVVQIGSLCNGALNWVARSVNPYTKGLISFDLSKEVYVFKIFYPPDDSIHECSLLAIKEGCVCILYKYHENASGPEKYIHKLYWKNKGGNYYILMTDSEKPYTFIPSTVMPSLISPYLQEGNE